MSHGGGSRHSHSHVGNCIVANKFQHCVDATRHERLEVVDSISWPIVVEANGSFVKQDEKGNLHSIGARLPKAQIAHAFQDSMIGPFQQSEQSCKMDDQKKPHEAQDAVFQSCNIAIGVKMQKEQKQTAHSTKWSLPWNQR